MSKEQDAKREALAQVVCNEAWREATLGCAPNWFAVADFILAREAERERPLVEAAEALAVQGVNDYGLSHVIVAKREHQALRDALARHRALDAPPQRTLAEVADRVLLDMRVPQDVRDELAAALAREEGKR